MLFQYTDEKISKRTEMLFQYTDEKTSKRTEMLFQYTDEKIPKRTEQGGRENRSVFGEESMYAGAAAGHETEKRRPVEQDSRWTLITEEELFSGSGGATSHPGGATSHLGEATFRFGGTYSRSGELYSASAAADSREPEDGQNHKGFPSAGENEPASDRFITLIRLIRGYQVTETGRRAAFLEQAKWMENYEEEGLIPETEFYHQYVGYQEMDVWELHGYFSWRTRFRRGESVPYHFEFIRLHAAELINRIGAGSRQETFERLLRLQAEVVCGKRPMRADSLLRRRKDTFGNVLRIGSVAGSGSLTPDADRRKMRRILAGFAVLWSSEEPAALFPEFLQEYCVLNPEREEENITLLHYDEISDGVLYRVLCSLAPSRTRSHEFLAQAGEDACRVTARVFRGVCRKQKQSGAPVLAQRLLGERRMLPRDLFPMLPYESPVKDGTCVEVSPATSYLFRDGAWYRSDYPLLRDEGALRELGEVIRECERVLRKKLHYRNQLPDRLKNPVLAKMIEAETDRWLREKELRNRPEIHVDFTKLGAIRNLAAMTRDRLLEGTDEGEETDALNMMLNGPLPGDGEPERGYSRHPDTEYAGGIQTEEESSKEGSRNAGALPESFFGAGESAFLRMLLEGKNGKEFFRDHKILPSVFVDAINEKAYDEIGDSIIEETGSGWTLVEDYREDIKQLL